MKKMWIVLLGDTLAFWLVFFLLLTLRLGGMSGEILQNHLIPFSILFVSWIIIFFLFGLYDLLLVKPTITQLKRFGIALLVCLSLGVIFFYLVPIFGIAPKTNLIFQVTGFGFISFFWRRKIFIKLKERMARPSVFVGSTNYLKELGNIVTSNPQIGLNLKLITPDINEALSEIKKHKNGVLVIESNTSIIPQRDINELYKINTQIIDIIDAYEQFLNKIPIDYIPNMWITNNINPNNNIFIKNTIYIFDTLLATLLLIISSPVWIIFSFLIYLNDKGPILYTQERVGLYGKTFKLFKFRSMVVDSEKDGAVWAEKKDPRITPIGAIMRKLHIDEIPQMINIIKGDIALVGPRPERPEFVEKLEESIPHYGLRHIILPGFTGWAQIKYRYARSIEDSKEKFEYDMYYIKNKNIFLDFGIIIRTIQIIFTH